MATDNQDLRYRSVADAEALTGITQQQVSRWRKRLEDPAKYRAQLLLAAYRKVVTQPPRQSLPTAEQRKDLLRWLRPVQVEFDGFIEHFLTVCEQRWASRGTAP